MGGERIGEGPTNASGGGLSKSGASIHGKKYPLFQILRLKVSFKTQKTASGGGSGGLLSKASGLTGGGKEAVPLFISRKQIFGFFGDQEQYGFFDKQYGFLSVFFGFFFART